MRKITSMILCMFMFALCISSSIPAHAKTKEFFIAPSTYNEHDYQKLVSFLEAEDEHGIKNGEKMNDAYDPNDPETWYIFDDIYGERYCFTWTDGEERRLADVQMGALGIDLVGELDLEGCIFLENCQISHTEITSLNVNGCESLISLWCESNRLSSINVEGCSAIQELCCNNNQITEIDVSDCNSLIGLWCEDNMITELDLHNLIYLIQLCCGGNNISTLDLTGLSSLRALFCSGNPLLSLDVSENAVPNLSSLYCSECTLQELDLANTPNLEELNCIGNNLRVLDVSKCSELYWLYCFENQLTEIVLGSNIRELDCSFNPLESIDLSNSVLIESLNVSYTSITELNLSCCSELCGLYFVDCDNLHEIDFSSCPSLVSINGTGTNLDFSGNPRIPIDTLSSVGNGIVQITTCLIQIGEDDDFNPIFGIEGVFNATSQDNNGFIGWYNENGDLVSSDNEIAFSVIEYEYTHLGRNLIAVFESNPQALGDLDNSGEVTATDALLALRSAMGILELTPEQAAVGDMNGDGTVSIDDALIILRTAMGLL